MSDAQYYNGYKLFSVHPENRPPNPAHWVYFTPEEAEAWKADTRARLQYWAKARLCDLPDGFSLPPVPTDYLNFYQDVFKAI